MARAKKKKVRVRRVRLPDGWIRPITAMDAAISTLRCALCVRDLETNSGLPEEEMKVALGNLKVSFTKIGLQVWCMRHNCNVIHIDFEGRKHPANTDCLDRRLQ